MPKLIVANWKLHPLTEAEAVRLAKESDHRHAIICPPFPFFSAVSKVLKRAALGAQDVFWESQGPYTGEVSGMVLKKLGARYVIIGHSERRAYMGEMDEMVNRKAHASLAVGLHPIVCVGEPKQIRKRGIAAVKRYVGVQLKRGLRGVRKNIIIAYEPIWAIGTGVPDKPEQSAEMSRFIKQFCRTTCHVPRATVLYGGSVKPGNARAFLRERDIDGALVGGASLHTTGFRKILAAAN